MHHVYVIRSDSHQTRYVGVTENIGRRLQEHNAGRCRYTRGRRPWSLLYVEDFNDLGSARGREIFLKSGQGRKFLDSILA